MKKIYAIIFDYRNILAGTPLIYALLSSRELWDNGMVIWPLAFCCCTIGIFIRGWAYCYCNYGKGKRKELAVSGPYALVRNPLYWGNMWVISGGIVASGLLWFLPIAVAWTMAVYWCTVQHEERRLVEKYGDDFIEYRKRVPRWIPYKKSIGLFAATDRHFLATVAYQCLAYLVLLPFLAKDLQLFHPPLTF